MSYCPDCKQDIRIGGPAHTCPESRQREALCPSDATTCSPVFLTLQEFTSGGSKYFRCADDIQRPLLSHLLNGAGACFFAEELPTVQRVANAHGWVLQILLENDQAEARAAQNTNHDKSN